MVIDGSRLEEGGQVQRVAAAAEYRPRAPSMTTRSPGRA
jgi:hypothetical protein